MAQTQEQRNVINHIGDITVIESKCPTLKVNEPWIGAALTLYKVDLKKTKFANMLRERIKLTSAKMSDIDSEIACASGIMLYGENGINVKKLLIPK